MTDDEFKVVLTVFVGLAAFRALKAVAQLWRPLPSTERR